MIKTVLITGTGRGLGLELSKQYAAAGWKVLACARRSSPALAGLAGIHGNVSVLPLDVTDHGQIDGLAKSLRGESIDVLINNAGVIGTHGFADGALEEHRFGASAFEEWEKIFRTNVMAPMKMAEAFVEHVAASGEKKIITLTSILGSMELNATGGLYAYRASKAAVNALMKSMAIDLAPRGIIAVAMHPGWVRTAMGGKRADMEAVESVTGMRRVIEQLRVADAGRVCVYDGSHLPY